MSSFPIVDYFVDQLTIPVSRRAFGPDPIRGFITIEELHQDVLEITEHPIEQGGVISDHAFKRPARVTMKIGWSNSPAGAIGGGVFSSSGLLGQETTQVAEIYQQLLKLQNAREPFDVFTGKRYYQDMLIKSLDVMTDKASEHSLSVTVTFQQVILVGTTTINIDRVPASAQSNPQSTQSTSNLGTQNLQPTTNVNAAAATQALNPQPASETVVLSTPTP